MGRYIKNRIGTNNKKEMTSFLFSLGIHTILLIAMSCVFLSTDTISKPVIIMSYSEEPIVFTEIEELPIQNIVVNIDPIEHLSYISDQIDLNESIGIETPEIKKGVPKPPKSSRKSKLGHRPRNNNPRSEKIRQRLAEYGAKTGDIQISLSWDNYNDIDLWVEYNGAYKDTICWNNKIGLSGGILDIDMNCAPMTNKAVENIFWDNAKPGLYTVYAYFYYQWDSQAETDIDVRIVEKGKETIRKVTLSPSRYISNIYSFKIPGPTYR